MRAALAIAFLVAAPATAQDFFTLKGHGGPIMDIAVGADGAIATASFDNSVGLWDGRRPQWLEAHRAAVNTVAFAKDDRLISGGDDFVLRGWTTDGTTDGSTDGGTDGQGAEIGRHSAKITDIEVHPVSGLVATASWDATIGLWREVPAAQPPRWDRTVLRGHAKGVNDVAFSDDGKRVYSASADGTIRIWDVASGQEVQRLANHGFGVNELILNEKDGWLAYGAVDGGTRMIDPETGAQIADFSLDRRPVLAMAYDPAGAQLAVGDGQGYIMVIDTVAKRITRDFRAAQRGPIWALAFSPDGHNIHAGGIEDVMYSWPVETLTEHGQMATATRSFLEDPAALPNGERQFKRKCSICHTVTPGSARKAGPSLYKLFGKPAGTERDYAYSDTLERSNIVWSAKAINDLFDLGPDHYIPGTKMPMQRIAEQQDRDDLIDYLRRATAEKGN